MIARGPDMRRAASVVAFLVLLAGCQSAPSQPPPTVVPTLAPTAAPPTSTPQPTPTPVVDPLAAVVARQADLQTFRQALVLDVEGIDPAGSPRAMKLWAEGESERPNSRLHVGTDALGAPLGFTVIQAERKLYLNPLGMWMALDAEAIPPGMPLVPVPVATDPRELLSLFQGAQLQLLPGGDSVRGTATDVLRFTLPPERAERLVPRLLLQQTVALLQGTPTYTDLGGEVAVGRADGFVRRIELLVLGYSGGDPARTFSIRSRTELWDVNDGTIAVQLPGEPILQLPTIGAPGR